MVNLLVSSLFLFVYNCAWSLSFEKALTRFYYWTFSLTEVEPLTVCARVHQRTYKNKRETFHHFLKGLLKMLHISVESKTVIWNRNEERDL